MPSWGIPLSKVSDGKWNEIQTHCVIVYMNSFNFSLEGLSHPNVQWRFRLTVWLQVWSNYTHVPVWWPESPCDVLNQSPNSTCKALKIPQVYLDATLQAVCTYTITHQHSYRFIWSLHLLHLLHIVVFWVSIYPANTWRQQQGVNISKPDFARSLQFPLMLRPHQPKQCHYYISIPLKQPYVWIIWSYPLRVIYGNYNDSWTNKACWWVCWADLVSQVSHRFGKRLRSPPCVL